MIKAFLSLLVITALTIPVFSQSGDAILGKWISSSGGGHIEIYKKGDNYFGKLIWLRNINDKDGNPRLDSKNPDPSLRKRPFVGIEVLKDFTYSGDNTWENGKVYDPNSGKTFSCKMIMSGSDILNIRGYVGISLLGKTETWTRAK